MPIAYVPYTPDPIEGQALLDDFTRTRRILRYRGSDGALRQVERGMPLYETRRVETVGEAESGNLLLRGECVSACAFLKERIDAGQMPPLDLVYIDPPFASGADYAKQVYLRRDPAKAAAARDAARQLDDEELRSFEETMYGDIWDKERYLNWMYENLRAIKTVMSESASIYVHLDYHIVHYVKILMDEIFGEANYRSDITWKRQTSSGFKGKTAMGHNHDNILVYSSGDEYVYNTEYLPYSEEYLAERFSHVEVVDGEERRFKDAFLGTATTPETIEQYKRENRIYYTSSGGMRLKVYEDEAPGIPLDDVWVDIDAVNSQASERVDYATQKPVALLERIVKASSDVGMTVADFFGGSGTTAVACAQNGRHFIHVDVGVNSIQTARQRLREIDGTSFDVYEIEDGVALYRNPAQTMEKLRGLVPGLAADEELSPFWAGAFHTAKEGLVPVFIPNLVDSSTKLLDEGTVLRVLNEELPELPASVRRVVLFYVDAVDPQSLARFADENNETLVAVELRDLKPLLAEAVNDDDFSFTVEEGGDTLEDVARVRITGFSSGRLEAKIEEFNMKGALGKKAASFKPLALSDAELELVELVSLDCTAAQGPWHADCEVFIDRTGQVTRDGRETGEFWDGSICAQAMPLRVKVRNIAGDETVKAVR